MSRKAIILLLLCPFIVLSCIQKFDVEHKSCPCAEGWKCCMEETNEDVCVLKSKSCPCAGVICNSPPESQCTDTQTLRVFNSPGECVLGECQYKSHEENCPNGCENNECKPPTCEWIPITTENAPMATSYARAVWMPEIGKMLVAGGLDHHPWASIYDPESDRWESVADCNTGHYNAGLVWTGEIALMWGDGGLYYDPAEGTCGDLPSPPVFLGSNGPSSIWTGNEMIIWGGRAAVDTIVGAKYRPGNPDPGQGSWTATSTGSGCPDERGDHATAWTGTEMIVWGGSIPPGANPTNTGARYDPQTDTWTPTSTGLDCPTPRAFASTAVVWTGKEMVVWGGGAGPGAITPVGDGGAYDPDTDSWRKISQTGAPPARSLHTAVWTGKEMIVWGGSNNGGGSNLNSGGHYNPNSDSWIPTAIDNAPTGRYGHVAVWTGKEMIIWGGHDSLSFLNDGAIYRCASNTYCGNGLCDDGETVKSCHTDCQSRHWECGNGVCEQGENTLVCPRDCLSGDQGCGDGTCDGGETAANCPGDCPLQDDPDCANGVCDAGESVATCPNDCQTLLLFNGMCENDSGIEECILNLDADVTFHLDAEYLTTAIIVGDMDNDGLDDIAFGAAGDSLNGEHSGSVYLVYGRREGFERVTPIAGADAILVGERTFDLFGYSVAAAGAVNGDGYADLLIGAPVSDYPDRPARGRVYLVPGGPERLSGENDISGEFYFGQTKFVDSQTAGSAGRYVSGAGDVDGDGFDDILIGAPFRRQDTSTGAAYLVYGRPYWEGSYPFESVLLDDVACGWVNNVDNTYNGWTVSGAGDINADGFADFLVGSPEYGNPEGMNSSRAYLIYGKGEQVTGIDAVSNADVTFVPSYDGWSDIGREIGAAGDVDGDGYDDFYIGEPGDADNRTKVYLFHGGPEKLSGELGVLHAGAVFTGAKRISTEDQSGVGDVNGDGYSDLAFGAVYQGKEAVFLFLGGKRRYVRPIQMTNANTVFFLRSDEWCSGGTGSVVKGGGDVNGDGFDDFLIGASGRCIGDGHQSHIYLVRGAGSK